MSDISNSEDMIDVRDVIARVEELEDELPASAHEVMPGTFEELAACQAELNTLRTLLEDLCGNGGDEQWRGDWYPIGLIRDSYFTEYAEELADDIGLVPSGSDWPARCIDWEQAAAELQMDYSSAEFEGVTYWYR